MLDVMRMHRDATRDINQECPAYLRQAARELWDRVVKSGEEHGYRNAQATVLAPTGTIAFMMDCDTTGIEPDIALVKYKQLAGGGMMKIINRTVPKALETLGYRAGTDHGTSWRSSKRTTRSKGLRTSKMKICRSSTVRSHRRTEPARFSGKLTST